MYQNLRSVGLPAKDASEVCAVALSLESIGTLHPTESGIYRHVGPDLGVEVWIHYDHSKKPMGIVPHFIGSGRMRCHVEGYWKEPIDPLLGFVFVQIQPLQEGKPYPLVVSLGEYESDLPFLTLNEEDKSQTIEAVIQIAAFAYLTRKVRKLRSPSVLAISATAGSLLCMPVAPISLAFSAYQLWKQRKSQKWLLALNAAMTLLSAGVTLLLIKVIMAIANAAASP